MNFSLKKGTDYSEHKSELLSKKKNRSLGTPDETFIQKKTDRSEHDSELYLRRTDRSEDKGEVLSKTKNRSLGAPRTWF